MPAIAYLHGFASNPSTKKGRVIAQALQALGLRCDLPDLNAPSFAKLTLSAQLAAVDAWAQSFPEDETFSLIGSSMGGWVATRWAELHPERVSQLILLAPAFDMIERWPKRVGPEGMRLWKAQDGLPFRNGDGVEEHVHWGFIEDAQQHPATPSVVVSSHIIHGRQDEVVPIASSRLWAASSPLVALTEVDDGHELMNSLDLICNVCRQALTS